MLTFVAPRSSAGGIDTSGTCSPVTTPVVLVHGYGGRPAQWAPLEWRLRRNGFATVHRLRLNPFTDDVPAMARRLVRTVRTLLDRTGAERVHLVGHSMGGIVIRYAVTVLGLDDVVDTAVTVASPHGGSPLARFGCGATAAQLRPGSTVLRALEQAARPGRTRWVSVYSDADEVVPAERALIRPTALAATHVLLPGQNHVGILRSRALADAVSEQLCDSEDRRAA
jgi:pimeloyl-ACP methyl ester carboxylesterase